MVKICVCVSTIDMKKCNTCLLFMSDVIFMRNLKDFDSNIYSKLPLSHIKMMSNMFDTRRALAMLEVIANQERVERIHNAPHGDTQIFQNKLLLLLQRTAVFESSDSNSSVKVPTIVKKYGMLRALWEQVLEEEVIFPFNLLLTSYLQNSCVWTFVGQCRRI
jgi:hypothetical protein